MKKTIVVALFCLAFMASISFAQAPPVGLTAEHDGLGGVSLNWVPPPTGEAFTEDFEDGVADGFTFDPADDFTVADGVLNLFRVGDNTWGSGYYEDATYGDCTVEVEVNKVEGYTSASIALLIRGSGYFDALYSGYLINITQGGSYSIWELTNGASTLIEGWLTSPAINSGLDNWNTMTVVANGADFTFYINDTEITSWNDATHASGYMGLGAYNSSGYTDNIDWDNFSVSLDDVILAEYGNTNAPAANGQLADIQLACVSPVVATTPTKNDVNGIINRRGTNVWDRLGLVFDNELDELVGYNIYRDDVLIGTSTEPTYDDVLPDFGLYTYYVTADYDPEGESEPSNTVDVEYQDTAADILIWNPDPTPASGENIDDILNDLGYSTYYTTDVEDVPWENYGCVFVFLGIYSNYQPVYDNSIEETVMVDYLDAGGLLYVEGGDIFGYNEPVNLMPYFNFSSTADGSGDLSQVEGVVGAFTEGWLMDYAGENNWIDHIEPGVGAELIFTNPADGAGCGILNDAGDYMTATFSFEVGLLTDGDNTREELVTNLMEWFDYLAGPQLTIVLDPWNDPTWVGPNGGSFRWDVTITNLSDQPVTYDAWTEVILPNQTVYGPIDLYFGLELGGGEVLTASPLTSVPSFAPNGIYTFFGKIGTYPNADAQDSFDFAKLPLPGPAAYEGNEGIGDWATSGWFEGDDAEFGASAVVPNEFAIEDVYPNPFNPTTNVAVALPNAADLQVNVYNVVGQVVAVLADGRFSQGYHNLTFDASDLSSGIYFVQAVVPGKMNQLRKVVLMK